MTRSTVCNLDTPVTLVLQPTTATCLDFDPEGAGYTVDRAPGLYRQLDARFSALPGVSDIGMALYSPLEGDNWGECVIQQGHPAPGPNDHCGSTWDRVSPGFRNSMGIPDLRGKTSPPAIPTSSVCRRCEQRPL